MLKLIIALFLIVRVQWIIDGIVQTAALLAFDGHAGDEIPHVDHVAKLAEVTRDLHALEERLGLLIEQIEAVPCTLQTQVGAYDTYIVRHDLTHLFVGLGDEHVLLVGKSAFIVPCRHLVVEVIVVDMLNTVFGGSVGIDDGLDERVAGQSVATMQSRA